MTRLSNQLEPFMVFDPSEFEAPRFDCSWIMLALGNLAKKQKSKLFSINNDIDHATAVSDVV